MSNDLIPQHKRLAMGLPVNNAPAGSNKTMIGADAKAHSSSGIHKNLKAPAAKSKTGRKSV